MVEIHHFYTTTDGKILLKEVLNAAMDKIKSKILKIETFQHDPIEVQQLQNKIKEVKKFEVKTDKVEELKSQINELRQQLQYKIKEVKGLEIKIDKLGDLKSQINDLRQQLQYKIKEVQRLRIKLRKKKQLLSSRKNWIQNGIAECPCLIIVTTRTMVISLCVKNVQKDIKHIRKYSIHRICW